MLVRSFFVVTGGNSANNLGKITCRIEADRNQTHEEIDGGVEVTELDESPPTPDSDGRTSPRENLAFFFNRQSL